MRPRCIDSVAQTRHPQGRPSALLGVVTLLVVVVVLGSCGGSLYKVKPISELPPMPSTAASASAGAITIRATPLVSDEESQELFESNLELAGLLPVRIQLVNSGGEPLELKKTKFHLRDGSGNQWKLVPAKKAVSTILKANGISAYNPESRKTFEKEFGAYELDLKTPLTQGQREGFLIFRAPRKEPVTSPRGLVLSVDGLGQPMALNLN